MKKRTLVICLMVIMAFSIFGCGSNEIIDDDNFGPQVGFEVVAPPEPAEEPGESASPEEEPVDQETVE